MPLDKLGRVEALNLIKVWLANPVTQTVLTKLRTEIRVTQGGVLYNDPPGMFEARFLLREQLIGEQRGLGRVDEIIHGLVEKYKETKTNEVNSESPEHEIPQYHSFGF